MLTINNVDIFDMLCRIGCPVTVCGSSGKIKEVYPILTACKLQITEAITDHNSIYNLYYGASDSRFVFVMPDNKADETRWVSLLEEMGLVKYRDFIVFQNNGNVGDWDAIDVNIGYSYKFAEMSYCQYGDDDADVTVVALGGSTTCSYEMWGVKSWPELLYERLSGGGRNVKILNGGISGYNSYSELMKIIRDVDAIKPDLVISLSGLNDAVYNNLDHPFYTPHLKAIYENFTLNTGKYCLPLTFGMKNTKEPAVLWVRNMQYMHEILKINGVDFIAFLQPLIVSDGYEMDEEETYMVNADKDILKCLDLEREFLHKARSRIKDIGFIKDISGCFDGQKGLYRDQYHVYETGNAMIAENIYKGIAERFGHA